MVIESGFKACSQNSDFNLSDSLVKARKITSSLCRKIEHEQRGNDDPPAVSVYTVCDESRYLVVRNVPALGCGDDLMKLFMAYGEVEECKPMDAEDCAEFTDVYWIKFRLTTNAWF